jgi:mono/diheme cytochrome c family protein
MPGPPDSPDSPEPTLTEAAFYGSTGLLGAFVITLTIGLSIIGFHISGDTRAAQHEDQAAAAASGQLDQGATVFAQRCASCHGAAGEGGVGPSFVGVVDRIPDPDTHAAVVRDGRGRMPAFEGVLSDEQIALVVAFEREVLSGQ